MNYLYREGKALSDEIEKTDMPYGTVSIWHLGQSGVIIKGKARDGALIIDPYLTENVGTKYKDN
ncbi:hypothetical protein PU629_12325 [Pullulanibacillus sp. KACC 23026]|uniref:hypothetical protein n=1 Tax=Pullulanibacillus sp. KACC 23026 TaxID=3028315 RepID=UPI0023B10193|nr:hypothetical protein [Pullulanibacillus sp. KACC 23026]WEG10963.1 hypothetical protein PU629_12325 [Pullulanibacillus sp. KACC 23026]